MLEYINLYSTAPDFNLAFEQHVFDSFPRDRSYFMLWQNNRAVIVGKYQNAYAEVNRDYLSENNIALVRRLSGGGAVYHDMGNLNFTFITDADKSGNINMAVFCSSVVRALAKCGVMAEINGRNDITVCGKKFSGNSQYIKQGRVMHHGTILFDSDLTVLSAVLNPDVEKMRAKGIKSVKSRVTNLKPLLPPGTGLEDFRSILLGSVLEETSGTEHIVTPQDVEAAKKISSEKYSTWQWNWGRSPECSFVKTAYPEGCGKVEAHITCDKGLITDMHFYGDFFSPEDPEGLQKVFQGVTPDETGYRQALKHTDVSRFFAGLDNEKLISVLTA